MSHETEKHYDEIFVLLKSIAQIEEYQQEYSDPTTFFPANYQRIYNDKVFLILDIIEELKKIRKDSKT